LIVFQLLTGPRESPPHGEGGVVGETSGDWRETCPPACASACPSASVATDLVIENDRLFDVGLPHLPPLTPIRSPSTVIVLHIDLLENE